MISDASLALTAQGWTGNQTVVSIALGVISLVGTLITLAYTGKLTRRQEKTRESLAQLEWAKEFEKRTQSAETKAQEADRRAIDAERRQIHVERQLASAEVRADALVELVDWVGAIIEAAHTADVTIDRLRAIIDHGPPAYRRLRRPAT